MINPSQSLVSLAKVVDWDKLDDIFGASSFPEKGRPAISTRLIVALLKLAKDFPRLLKNPKSPAREKKRMIRFLIEDVTMTRGKEILLCVRFKNGATKTMSLPLPLKGWQHNVTDPEIVKIVEIFFAIAQFLKNSATGRNLTKVEYAHAKACQWKPSSITETLFDPT